MRAHELATLTGRLSVEDVDMLIELALSLARDDDRRFVTVNDFGGVATAALAASGSVVHISQDFNAAQHLLKGFTNVEYVQSDAPASLAPEDSVDIVVLCASSNVDADFRSWSRALRDDGVIFVSTRAGYPADSVGEVVKTGRLDLEMAQSYEGAVVFRQRLPEPTHLSEPEGERETPPTKAAAPQPKRRTTRRNR